MSKKIHEKKDKKSHSIVGLFGYSAIATIFECIMYFILEKVGIAPVLDVTSLQLLYIYPATFGETIIILCLIVYAINLVVFLLISSIHKEEKKTGDKHSTK